MTLIKVCGLTREKDVTLARQLGADWFGFIHVEGSPRHLDLARLDDLLTKAKGLTRVLVVRDQPFERLRQLRQALSFEFFQFHGNEGPEYLSLGGYRAFHMAAGEPGTVPETFGEPFLLDTVVAGQKGGTGSRFDWEILPQVKGNYLVAGGLNPDNVGELVNTYQPWGVDVSSGVEAEPGIKDPAKLTSFIENVRRQTSHD